MKIWTRRKGNKDLFTQTKGEKIAKQKICTNRKVHLKERLITQVKPAYAFPHIEELNIAKYNLSFSIFAKIDKLI